MKPSAQPHDPGRFECLDRLLQRAGDARDRTARCVAGVALLGIGDLMLAEVLQGFRTDADYETARYLLLSLPVFEMLGVASALRSAEAYRTLRKKGVTIRKTTDVIIATFCITEGHALLFSYRDFLPFVQHLGLQPVVGSP